MDNSPDGESTVSATADSNSPPILTTSSVGQRRLRAVRWTNFNTVIRVQFRRQLTATTWWMERRLRYWNHFRLNPWGWLQHSISREHLGYRCLYSRRGHPSRCQALTLLAAQVWVQHSWLDPETLGWAESHGKLRMGSFFELERAAPPGVG